MRYFKFVLLLLSFNSYAQITEQWARRYSSSGDYSAKYSCMAKDNSGNFYLGGYVVSIDNNRDYLIVKLNSNLDTVWTRSFRGTDNSGDEVTAIAVDKNANVYVTGFANGNGTGNDILTIKLNTNGDSLWTRFYNYIANEDDNGTSIAVDTLGNVFVTGESDANATNVDNFDYITIKYDPSGTELWNKRYGAVGNDKAVKVLTDLVGNCYVTGRGYNGIDDNYVTIKYNAAGTQQWIKAYDGGGDDQAASMAIDSTYTNIYVTGRSDNGNNDDIITIKYNTSAGTLLWTKPYTNVDDDRGVMVTVDAIGNVYVIGESDADASSIRNWNFVVIKYTTSSSLVWLKTYNSTLTNSDIPTDIKVASNGDVYVTGLSDFDNSPLTENFNFTTLKYSSAGTLQWTKTFAGTGISTGSAKALVLDNLGLPIIAGSSENLATQKDAYVIKYDAAGNPAGVHSYLGSGDNSENAYKIFVDANENSYIAGYSIQQETDRNMTTLKINALGDTQWVRNYNGTSSISLDAANDILTDATGNVFVTGFTKNSGVSNDFTTIKYNSNGDSVWIKKYNNALVNGSDKANAIAQDATGNTYVTGYSETTNGTVSDDFLTIKYNANGVQQWAMKYNGPGNGEDRSNFIRVNSTYVFVGGRAWNGSNFDFALRIYSLAGSLVGSALYDGSFGDDIPAGMEIDAQNNVYLTGKSASALGNLNTDIATVKYNSSGNLQWAKRFDGSLNAKDEANAIAIDNNANVFVTGVADADPLGIGTTANFATLAYNANGDTLWTRFYNGASNLNDAATAIVTDTYGNCFVTGEIENGTASASNYDILTIKYSPTGATLVTAVYNGTGKDSPNSISIKNNNVFICGSSYGSAQSQKDMIILKYDDFTLSLIDMNTDSNKSLVFPNPANDYFNIDLSTIYFNKKNTFFALFNQNGELVKRVEVKEENNLKISCDELAAGLYYYRISASGSIVDSGKIVLK
jgi:uncharacterized delta-60 repeat protein